MKIKVPPVAVDWVVHPVARAVAASWRSERVNRGAWDGLVAAGRGFACMLWHEALLPLLWHHRDAHAVIVVSQARDGRRGRPANHLAFGEDTAILAPRPRCSTAPSG